MADFTIPGDGVRDDYLVVFPVYLLATRIEPDAFSFVIAVRSEGHSLVLFTEEDFAWQAIRAFKLEEAIPFRMFEPASLKNVLIRASETTGATHVAIDPSQRNNPAAGRVHSLHDVISILDADDL